MRNKTFKAVAVSTVLVAVLAGCSNGSTPQGNETPTTPAVTQTDEPTEKPEVTETAEPTEKPAVDEFSQEIDGKVYQGTEKAPVRIGTDKPGEIPALQKSNPPLSKGEDMAAEQNKYVVLVGKDPESGMWNWKVRGVSRHGSFRDIERSWESLGSEKGNFKSAKAAMADGFTADGRILDRAEYMLAVYDTSTGKFSYHD